MEEEKKEKHWLEPRDTEEIKPGLFIQKKGKAYRQVHPAAWDGKINWNNMLFGGSVYKTFMWFGILLFLVWSYQHDVAQYKDFYENIQNDPVAFCKDASVNLLQAIECTDEREKLGLCSNALDILVGNISFNLTGG